MSEPDGPSDTELVAAPPGRGFAQRLSGISRPAKTLIVLGTVLVILALTGFLQADRDLEITSEQAVEIARPEIEFEPGQTTVRLVRQGAGLSPVWAVSFAVEAENVDGFVRLSVVRIDARSGEVLEVVHEK
ncbi:MAG: hypothetical protein GY724_03880 [Actinomycetia bacterium]|nr:hypothetical protein [Actinomycetes bacterium]MCP4224101.1 hypothetical protein [Actinomycetes bacterium]MCP5034405.1 hypothetical protein [Actinomycetes bacterium]